MLRKLVRRFLPVLQGFAGVEVPEGEKPLPHYDGKTIDPETGEVFDCQTCGACCGPAEVQGGWPEVMPEDAKNFSVEEFQSVVTSSLTGFPAMRNRYVRGFGNACVFLNGLPGKSVGCGIYERRPVVCREFPPGGVECRKHRLYKNIHILHRWYKVTPAAHIPENPIEPIGEGVDREQQPQYKS